jgi:tetratricopeptide (TPR) repeat protein
MRIRGERPEWAQTVALMQAGDGALAAGKTAMAVAQYDAAMDIWPGLMVREELHRKRRIAELLGEADTAIAALELEGSAAPLDDAALVRGSLMTTELWSHGLLQATAALVALDGEKQALRARLAAAIRAQFTRAMLHTHRGELSEALGAFDSTLALHTLGADTDAATMEGAEGTDEARLPRPGVIEAADIPTLGSPYGGAGPTGPAGPAGMRLRRDDLAEVLSRRGRCRELLGTEAEEGGGGEGRTQQHWEAARADHTAAIAARVAPLRTDRCARARAHMALKEHGAAKADLEAALALPAVPGTPTDDEMAPLLQELRWASALEKAAECTRQGERALALQPPDTGFATKVCRRGRNLLAGAQEAGDEGGPRAVAALERLALLAAAVAEADHKMQLEVPSPTNNQTLDHPGTDLLVPALVPDGQTQTVDAMLAELRRAAELYTVHRDYAAAAEAYEGVAAVAAAGGLLGPEDLAEIQNRLGLCAERVGDEAGALVCYNRGVEGAAGAPPPQPKFSLHFHRGRLFQRMGDFAAAAGDYAVCRRLQPGNKELAALEMELPATRHADELEPGPAAASAPAPEPVQLFEGAQLSAGQLELEGQVEKEFESAPKLEPESELEVAAGAPKRLGVEIGGAWVAVHALAGLWRAQGWLWPPRNPLDASDEAAAGPVEVVEWFELRVDASGQLGGGPPPDPTALHEAKRRHRAERMHDSDATVDSALDSEESTASAALHGNRAMAPAPVDFQLYGFELYDPTTDQSILPHPSLQGQHIGVGIVAIRFWQDLQAGPPTIWTAEILPRPTSEERGSGGRERYKLCRGLWLNSEAERIAGGGWRGEFVALQQ